MTGTTEKPEPITPRDLPPVVPDLFQALNGAERYGLVGGHCPRCDRYFFPLVERCTCCYGTLARTVFGERGRIYSFTVVRTKAPFSLPEPYAVGYVDSEDVGLRIFGLIDPGCIDRLTLGAKVKLRVMLLGGDRLGRPCLRPVFTLSQESE